jgi:hypothetical protein
LVVTSAICPSPVVFCLEIHNDYIGIGKAVDSNDPIPPIQMPRGYGGVAILWKKELDSLITSLKNGNERIQCVETEI